MPGFDRSLQQRDGDVDLQGLLASYVLAPQKAVLDATLNTALMLQKLSRKPSVFAGLNLFSSLTNYPPPTADNYTRQLLAITTSLRIYVFSIEDADIVKLSVASSSNIGTILVGYALTPLIASTQIPLYNFANAGPSALLGSNGNNFLWEEIPCSGNRFLHVFGIDNGQDIFSQTTTFLSLALIK